MEGVGILQGMKCQAGWFWRRTKAHKLQIAVFSSYHAHIFSITQGMKYQPGRLGRHEVPGWPALAPNQGPQAADRGVPDGCGSWVHSTEQPEHGDAAAVPRPDPADAVGASGLCPGVADCHVDRLESTPAPQAYLQVQEEGQSQSSRLCRMSVALCPGKRLHSAQDRRS
ncbi:hypothetical protein DUNSADRAFT_14165 [Dunaliella salina]|uniref:Encoded protein n=1 Tax=Dunaliella salina TaxID=3046 RepID=A0ABQ7H2S9_DUNSA|nr:hypothetical protein DUNSADRAFT_14165 [Dunaliella salina]|eukprot:KAF5841162.1 hypothetical protein DUNSADRAFT_14165 [Dunaliella salina]